MNHENGFPAVTPLVLASARGTLNVVNTLIAAGEKFYKAYCAQQHRCCTGGQDYLSTVKGN